MKRKGFVGFLAAGFLALITVGCQKGAEDSAEAEEMFSVIDTMRMQVKDEGIFYIDGFSEQMKFYDFNLAESVPICDRPNCEHDSADCSAYFPQGYMSGMGCYRGKIYYYDNMAQGLPVYQCDKNGSNRKLLAKLNKEMEYANLSVTLPVFFVEDEMIFGLQYTNLLTEPIEKEDGTLVDQENFWMLGKLNLKKGDFEIVKKPESYDGYTQWIGISDYAQGNLFYYLAGGTDREQHIYNIEKHMDELLFQEGDSPVNHMGTMQSVGCEVYLSDDGQTCKVYTVDAKTKETELVLEKEIPEGKELYESMAGDDLLYCVYEKNGSPAEAEEFGAVNLRTGEERALTREEYWYAPTTAVTENWYVGTAEEGKICIPKEAYKAKDWSKVQLIGSF